MARDDRGYILVDDQLQTNVPGIWALGDCNGKGAFTHTAYNDFEIVAANLLDGCALSLPCHAPGELPVGLMVWSTALQDDVVLDVSLAIETALAA